MYRVATVRVSIATVLAIATLSAQEQTASSPAPNDWRRIGNALIDRQLAGLATGPVDRVWYSADGSQLMIRTSSDVIFATSDFETWHTASASAPIPVSRAGAATLP